MSNDVIRNPGSSGSLPLLSFRLQAHSLEGSSDSMTIRLEEDARCKFVRQDLLCLASTK